MVKLCDINLNILSISEAAHSCYIYSVSLYCGMNLELTFISITFATYNDVQSDSVASHSWPLFLGPRFYAGVSSLDFSRYMHSRYII